MMLNIAWFVLMYITTDSRVTDTTMGFAGMMSLLVTVANIVFNTMIFILIMMVCRQASVMWGGGDDGPPPPVPRHRTESK